MAQEVIEAIQKNLDAITVQMQEEIRRLGEATEKTRAAYELLQRQLAELKEEQQQTRKQVDAIDARTQRTSTSGHTGGFRGILEKHEGLQQLVRSGRGIAVLSVPTDELLLKTTITSASISIQPERMPGIVPEPRRQLRIRNLLTSIPVQSNAVEFVRVLSHAKVVSPQVEGQVKAESEITFTLASANVRTIATWIPATRQVLEDFDGLQGFVQSSLVFSLEEEFEDQLLLGSGAGQNLHGLFTQAANFDTTLLGSRWNQADVIARAIQQLAAADELTPDFVCLHPRDYWTIRLMKDSDGRYILNEPANAGPAQLWGLTIVPTTAMSPGTFLVGTSSPAAAVIRMRQDATVEISTEHADYFVRNMVAIRAELRAALVVMRPGAYVKGNLTSSPA